MCTDVIWYNTGGLHVQPINCNSHMLYVMLTISKPFVMFKTDLQPVITTGFSRNIALQ